MFGNLSEKQKEPDARELISNYDRGSEKLEISCWTQISARGKYELNKIETSGSLMLREPKSGQYCR